jgi:hypothetical protein
MPDSPYRERRSSAYGRRGVPTGVDRGRSGIKSSGAAKPTRVGYPEDPPASLAPHLSSSRAEIRVKNADHGPFGPDEI